MSDEEYSDVEKPGDSQSIHCTVRSNDDCEASRIDVTFSLLDETRRRYLLYIVQQTDPTTLTEAARTIAAAETEYQPANVPNDVLEDVRVDLQHVHLPKLQDSGVIEYDARNGDIRCGSLPEPLASLLDMAVEKESDFSLRLNR